MVDETCLFLLFKLVFRLDKDLPKGATRLDRCADALGVEGLHEGLGGARKVGKSDVA